MAYARSLDTRPRAYPGSRSSLDSPTKTLYQLLTWWCGSGDRRSTVSDPLASRSPRQSSLEPWFPSLRRHLFALGVWNPRRPTSKRQAWSRILEDSTRSPEAYLSMIIAYMCHSSPSFDQSSTAGYKLDVATTDHVCDLRAPGRSPHRLHFSQRRL